MVETSKTRKRNQSLTGIPDRFRPPLRSILVQSVVRAIRVIIVQVIWCKTVDVATITRSSKSFRKLRTHLSATPFWHGLR
jgi:hypothetical protein